MMLKLLYTQTTSTDEHKKQFPSFCDLTHITRSKVATVVIGRRVEGSPVARAKTIQHGTLSEGI